MGSYQPATRTGFFTITAAQLSFALSACSAPPAPQGAPPALEPACYDHIRELSAYDRELSTRRDHKSEAAQLAPTSSEFVAVMLDAQEDGDAFSCGLTRSWVTEVFEGLDRQYAEYSYDDGIDGSMAGYRTYVGDELTAFLRSRAGSEAPSIYHVRHTGTEDHVFTLEQLPRGQGYRIYQSYVGAYSLKAWLSESTDGLFEADTGEIMVWRGLQAAADDFIQQLTDGQASLDNLDALPAELEHVRAYWEYVRDYDEEEVVANFSAAWERYGKGRVLSEEELFNDYLIKVAALTVYFNENDHQSDPFPQDVWDTWIELYGSPNPLHFPGLSHNFFPDLIVPDRDYRFETLEVVLPGDGEAVNAACTSNAGILDQAIVRPAAGDE